MDLTRKNPIEENHRDIMTYKSGIGKHEVEIDFWIHYLKDGRITVNISYFCPVDDEALNEVKRLINALIDNHDAESNIH